MDGIDQLDKHTWIPESVKAKLRELMAEWSIDYYRSHCHKGWNFVKELRMCRWRSGFAVSLTFIKTLINPTPTNLH